MHTVRGASIKYPDMKVSKESLWCVDEVHLSNVGNEVFLNGIQDALEDIIVNQATVSPATN